MLAGISDWADGKKSEGKAEQQCLAARNAGAVGVFYWEPTWYAIKGNGWDPADPSSGVTT